MPQHLASGKRAGFRLLDLLVAVLLVSLFGGVVIASVGGVQAAAQRAQSRNNLKQILLATVNCADSHNGKLVPGRGNFYPSAMLAPFTGYGPCLFHILAYLEQDNLYKASLVTGGSPQFFASWVRGDTALKVYTGPGDPTANATPGHTSYLANGLALPRFGARFPAFIADGTSNTIFYAEGYSRAIDAQGKPVERLWWDDPTWTPTLTGVMFQVTPAPEAASIRLPQSFHPGALEVGMGDGSVHPVRPSCSSKTFYEACTPSGGEVLGNDW